MDKMRMESQDLTQANIEKIAELFPGVITEAVGEDGKLKKAVNFALLKQVLSDDVIDGDEAYEFTWVGKKASIVEAGKPIRKTLRPVAVDETEPTGLDSEGKPYCSSGSKNWESTENLYIEGDNLDVLKLLQESYLGKVKMIYIDPPYNTGNDFIYRDNFTMDKDDYDEESGAYGKDGDKLFRNTESNGRFHSDWCSMMYPRLVLARNMLKDDGAIFISIEDKEAHNLRKICDEVFGASNFVADLCVVNNLKGRNDKRYIARANERLLMYIKSDQFDEYGLNLSESVVQEYKEEDGFGKYRLLELRKRGGADTRKERPNMYYSFFVNPKTGNVSLEQNELYIHEALPVKSNGVDGRWRWGTDKAKRNINMLFGREVGNKYNIYVKDYLESDDGARRVRPKSVLAGAQYSTDVATKEYRALMSPIDFNNPKPVAMLQDLVLYTTSPTENAVILDFFSGSATTAHAVMQLNAEDGGNRKFIMVQLPEECPLIPKPPRPGIQTSAKSAKSAFAEPGKRSKPTTPEKKALKTSIPVSACSSSTAPI